jgi:hypothetical protein
MKRTSSKVRIKEELVTAPDGQQYIAKLRTSDKGEPFGYMTISNDGENVVVVPLFLKGPDAEFHFNPDSRERRTIRLSTVPPNDRRMFQVGTGIEEVFAEPYVKGMARQ